MLEFLLNIVDWALYWAMMISAWFLFGALCLLVIVGILCLTRPLWVFIASVCKLAVNLVLIARGRRPRYNWEIEL